MLQSIWAARWYLLLGILTFLIVLVVNTPLHFIWQYAEPALGRMPIRIQSPTGTLWQAHFDRHTLTGILLQADFEQAQQVPRSLNNGYSHQKR